MLKRVSIQNFKSLKDVTLDLQKVNLLIGPNNSGKTNFLKALEYVGEDNANQIEPNRNKIAFSRKENQTISIQLKFDPKSPKNYTEEYYYVIECKISLNGKVNKSAWNQELTQSTSKTYSADEGPFTQSILKNKTGPLIIYKPDPNKLSKPGVVGSGSDSVTADASNLVGFLDLMLGKYRKSVFNCIEDDIHQCVPEFSEISLEDAKPTDELKKEFGDKSFKRLGLTNSEQGITYWADELSEGTLYFLALLCIINQPNPPKVLLLEEPEKGIHPRRIYEVIQFIFELVEDKDIQVIMTTHSPTVVDMFKDMPESVFIFDKDDEGATHVKNLQKDIIEPETAESERLGIDPPRYLNGLGEAWKVGFLGGVPR